MDRDAGLFETCDLLTADEMVDDALNTFAGADVERRSALLGHFIRIFNWGKAETLQKLKATLATRH